MEVHVDGPGVVTMSISLENVAEKYVATYELKRPRGWKQSLTVGHYWRSALVVFFNYGVDYRFGFQVSRLS